ncbi:MAG: FKBP-type peptidyl-prolyl cis-trans isomerase [Saprospiraceae bacterium]|jgi:FKBP-type peptidyl-prolyl cis-trans isomerase FkpA|nr:FKBP-type peptidyl-prolyl cis-trans isomerase [Saprospiraceae bacterium]
MSRFFSIPFFILAFGLVAGCIPDPISAEEQLKTDIKKIEDYLADNNLTAQSTASGLHYIIEEEGTGGHPSATSEVTVNYKGYFLDGGVFDQTNGTPITFSLQNVIEGWTEGIPLFKKGGKGKLFIPSALAYGNSGQGSIPGRTVIAFDVELVDF